ncbi:MAG: hypothetical protein ACFFD2_10430 [Promethearchaeota archaeon]
MKRLEVVDHHVEVLFVLEINRRESNVNMRQIPYDQFRNMICLKDAKEISNYIIHVIYYLSFTF